MTETLQPISAILPTTPVIQEASSGVKRKDRKKGYTFTTHRHIEAKKFAKAYIKNGGVAAHAALEIKPYAATSARTVGIRMLKREDVQKAIAEAMEQEGISFGYLLNARKQFVDAGLKQLNGQKRENEPLVSPKDVHSHLLGLEAISKRLEEAGGENNSSRSVHLHLDSKSVPEVLAKRNEVSSWFTSILDGEVIDTESK
jgi:hypothetical protein